LSSNNDQFAQLLKANQFALPDSLRELQQPKQIPEQAIATQVVSAPSAKGQGGLGA
jgi:hypothetical protein